MLVIYRNHNHSFRKRKNDVGNSIAVHSSCRAQQSKDRHFAQWKNMKRMPSHTCGTEPSRTAYRIVKSTDNGSVNITHPHAPVEIPACCHSTNSGKYSHQPHHLSPKKMKKWNKLTPVKFFSSDLIFYTSNLITPMTRWHDIINCQ